MVMRGTWKKSRFTQGRKYGETKGVPCTAVQHCREYHTYGRGKHREHGIGRGTGTNLSTVIEIVCTEHMDTIILQVNKKFCELKGGNIGIVEKAQETRFGMSRKYSSYIGIAS